MPPEALVIPRTPDQAIAWIEWAVRLIGPRFHPDTTFSEYVGVQRYDELDVGEVGVQLDATLAAARSLLGPRALDIAYRSAVSYLEEIDGEWMLWARPVTQPPARWWLVEPPELRRAVQPTTVAYQDETSNWWEYDPGTGLLHETPWHFVQFYYPTEPWIYRYTALEPAEARAHIERGTGAHEIAQLRSSRERDERAMDPRAVLDAQPGPCHPGRMD